MCRLWIFLMVASIIQEDIENLDIETRPSFTVKIFSESPYNIFKSSKEEW